MLTLILYERFPEFVFFDDDGREISMDASRMCQVNPCNKFIVTYSCVIKC